MKVKPRPGLILFHDAMNPFLLRNIAQIWPIVVLNSLANPNQKKYITFVVLEIKPKPCLGSFVLMSPFAMSKSRVGYRTRHLVYLTAMGPF
jgi:hypothetical protein